MPKFLSKQRKQIILIFLITAGLLFLYGMLIQMFECHDHALRVVNMSFEETKIVDFKGWNLIHLIYYFILGAIFPKEIWFLFAGSALWETYEYVLWKFTKQDEEWMYPDTKDLVFNAIGLLAGAGLHVACKSFSLHSKSSVVL